MKKWTERSAYLAGLLAVMAGASAAQQGCGGEDSTSEAGGCTSPQISCGGMCVDTSSDSSHCGTCNNACAADQSCIGGQCQCPTGTSLCAGACIDTDSDPNNCGGCDSQCEEGEACVGGVCGCPDGQAACTSGCTDLQTDPLNCGQCNVPCVAGQECEGGECVCPDGKELCFSQCVDTTSDSQFCGNCSTACDSGEFCNESNCETINSCGDVNEDQYEGNDTCALARPLPEAAEGIPLAVVGDPTLHHTDQTLDTDWFSILATEAFHLCSPLSAQCYFVFDIAFTPPDVAAHDTYEMCISVGSCGGTPVCTSASDWNDTAGKYELSLSWEGSCGIDDNKQFYVEISRNGGQESCEQYKLEYQTTFTDESCS